VDARDRLTAVLLLARRKTGIVVPKGRFSTEAGRLASAIRDVREDLQALEGQLAQVEEMARAEAKARVA
jgi:hypothetical protein